jgi:hypothetical protein
MVIFIEVKRLVRVSAVIRKFHLESRRKSGASAKTKPAYLIRPAFSASNHQIFGKLKSNSGSFSGRPNRSQ